MPPVKLVHSSVGFFLGFKLGAVGLFGFCHSQEDSEAKDTVIASLFESNIRNQQEQLHPLDELPDQVLHGAIISGM